MKITCDLCPHNCKLEDNQTGFCRARKNIGDRIVCINYGKLTSIALDPIEKKPLRQFMVGNRILSIGSFGCNLGCPFCQNSDIAMAGGESADVVFIPPAKLIDKALDLVSNGNIGIAYTYNEPLIGYEYVMDCAKLARENALKNILVTNGYICEEPLNSLLPFIDAMNIDLKGFTRGFYKNIQGDLETVKRTIELANERCHIEVTTLIIPEENDSMEEIDSLSKWISELNKNIPLHLTRFFPRYQYNDKKPTSVDSMHKLYDVASRYLNFVYLGNC